MARKLDLVGFAVLFMPALMLAIMNGHDVQSPGSIPLCAGRCRGMDEPTSLADD